MAPEQTVENATEIKAGAAEENPLATMQADLERFRDLALRSQADFDNFRKRAAREKEDAIKYANGAFLEKLIPIIDNFELGLSAAQREKSSVVQGMSMVAKQFQDFLQENGVQTIQADGLPFDPNVHEALSHEESADVAEGHVIRQARRGYKLKERLLRPANVIVSKGQSPAQK